MRRTVSLASMPPIAAPAVYQVVVLVGQDACVKAAPATGVLELLLGFHRALVRPEATGKKLYDPEGASRGERRGRGDSGLPLPRTDVDTEDERLHTGTDRLGRNATRIHVNQAGAIGHFVEDLLNVHESGQKVAEVPKRDYFFACALIVSAMYGPA